MDVYEPQEDSFLVKKHLKKYSGKRALDVGTGSGILADELLKTFEEVIAVDINPNVKTKAKFIHSDLFQKVKGKFDLIVCNPPYLPHDEGIEDPALYGGKEGWEFIAKFLKQVGKYLKKEGKILIIFTSHSNPTKIFELMEENCFIYNKLDQKHIFFEDIFLYELSQPHFFGVSHLKYLSKGKRGFIFTGTYKSKKVSIKVKNPSSQAMIAIENEAKFLQILNKKGIGPQYVKSEDYLMYEYIDGMLFRDWLKGATKKEIVDVLDEIERQCVIMDDLGINKFEMTRPLKNILITQDGPVLIDFERCRFSQRKKNVSQFLEFRKKTE